MRPNVLAVRSWQHLQRPGLGQASHSCALEKPYLSVEERVSHESHPFAAVLSAKAIQSVSTFSVPMSQSARVRKYCFVPLSTLHTVHIKAPCKTELLLKKNAEGA